MTRWDYGYDRWLWPVVITSANQSFGWKEGGVSLSATIAAGTYWCHNDDSLDSDYPSLYKAVEAAMLAESSVSGDSNSYVIEPGTPTGSPDQIYGGVRIRETTGAGWDWIDFGAATTIADRPIADYPGVVECLGFEGEDGADISSVSGIVYSTRTAHGMWSAPELATTKLGPPQRMVTPSTQYPERDDFYVVDRGRRVVRRIGYEYVPGAHVYPDRADDLRWADVGQLGLGDDHNAMLWLWEALAEGREAILVHFEPNEDFDLQVDTHAYEVVRLEGSEAREDFRNVLSLRFANGELYDIQLPVVVTGTSTYYY